MNQNGLYNMNMANILLLLCPNIFGYIINKIFGLNKEPQSNWYKNLNKSPLTPPNWVFSPIWIFLYICIGIVLVILAHTINVNNNLFNLCILLILLQLMLNYSWSPVFFVQRNFDGAKKILTLMILVQMLTLIVLLNVNKLAFLLMIPYTLWILFAYHLNDYITLNN